MPLSSSLVGTSTSPLRHRVDARWLMAYAAGLGATDARYYDTLAGLAMHPVFPVCVEWNSILALRYGPGAAGMSEAEQARAVHADHDLHILSPVTGDAELHTTATAVAVERRTPGAYLLKRLDTVDDAGRLVFRTWQGTLYRGVEVTGPDRAIAAPPPWPSTTSDTTETQQIPVPAQAAHVYTECARIWNPIHTDVAHARAAGLPAILLHGTATLALAVSALVRSRLDGDPRRVRRLGGRFSGMVLMPTMLSLKSTASAAGRVAWSVATPDGRDVISRAYMEYAS